MAKAQMIEMIEDVVMHPDFLCLGPILCIIPGMLIGGIGRMVWEWIK